MMCRMRATEEDVETWTRVMVGRVPIIWPVARWKG